MPYGSGLSEAMLRSMAHERIEDGRLPLIFPREVNAGYGSGALCRLCEQPVEYAQVEYEVSGIRGDRLLTFHLVCHAVWQLECVAMNGRCTADALASATEPVQPPAARV